MTVTAKDLDLSLPQSLERELDNTLILIFSLLL